MATQAGKGVDRIAVPFENRIEGVVGVGVAGADRGFSAQRVVLCGGRTAAPRAAGVKPDLTNHVEDG